MPSKQVQLRLPPKIDERIQRARKSLSPRGGLPTTTTTSILMGAIERGLPILERELGLAVLDALEAKAAPAKTRAA